MKLSKILQEIETPQNASQSEIVVPHLTKEEIKSALNEISNYNSHSKEIRREIDLNEVAEKIGKSVEMAERIALSRLDEQNKWFDKKTTERNMMEAKKYANELKKVAGIAQENLNQMEALYEEIGQKLNRYFKINEIS